MSGIHGQLLEITVVGCSRLKDTEWISRQDPYVCLEYGSTKFRTRTCTDGGKNPTFQEKFTFTLIEGLQDLNVRVWNSNTVSTDDFIGSGKIQLQKVLTQGYDDSSWTLSSGSGRHSGEVRVILHYGQGKTNKPGKGLYPGAHTSHHVPAYAPPPSYPPTATAAYSVPPPYTPYPPNPAAYPASPYPSHPAAYPPHSAYPPQQYPPPPQPTAYYPPPGPYPGTYPPPY